MIELWELGGLEDCRYSTFSWRARLALRHKGLAFTVHPVRVSDKDAIAFSGQKMVPILRHDGQVVTDSWRIAAYLERAFPDRPSLFGGPVGESLTRIFALGVDRDLIPKIVPYLAADVLECVAPEDARHLEAQFERFFRRPVAAFAGERDQALPAFGRALGAIRKGLESAPFIAGAAPAYADHVLFGVLQWARVVSTCQVLESDDPVAGWFERMLDAYGGEGRREPARAGSDRGSDAG